MNGESQSSRGAPPDRVGVLGCAFDNLDLNETLARVEQIVRERSPRQHAAVNVDVLVRIHRDPAYRLLIESCDLVNADGMPIVLASRLLGHPLKARVAAPDLFDRLLSRADELGWRIFLLGARAPVVERVSTNIQQRYPGINVVGVRDGYWQEEDEPALAESVRLAAPDVLFVATSSPKKERFLHHYRDTMRVPFSMGIGGVFDIVAGETRRAPRFLQSVGLEWFYRFLQEPRRMFRRYFVDDIYFFVLLARELTRPVRGPWRSSRRF